MKKSTGTIVLSLGSFAIGAIFSAAWIYIVMVIGGRNDFSHAQVAGACANVLIVTVLLTYWGYRLGVAATRVAGTVTLSLSLAVGMAFAAIAAPTDSTGLWGVGFLIIVVCSLFGIGLITSVTVAALRFVLARK